MYLVEGDSAGGSAKLGRDRKFQAILPLRGKVINTEKARLEDIFKNEEINTIIHTIGAGVGTDFKIEDSNYNRVIIMTDADTDGAHIPSAIVNILLQIYETACSSRYVLLYLHFINWKKVKAKQSELNTLGQTKSLINYKKELGKGFTLQRYKGLGEMNPEQLWETTMNPETRTLIRVQVEDEVRSSKRVTTLMGDKVQPRREWIEKHVEFGMQETKVF